MLIAQVERDRAALAEKRLRESEAEVCSTLGAHMFDRARGCRAMMGWAEGSGIDLCPQLSQAQRFPNGVMLPHHASCMSVCIAMSFVFAQVKQLLEGRLHAESSAQPMPPAPVMPF